MTTQIKYIGAQRQATPLILYLVVAFAAPALPISQSIVTSMVVVLGIVLVSVFYFYMWEVAEAEVRSDALVVRTRKREIVFGFDTARRIAIDQVDRARISISASRFPIQHSIRPRDKHQLKEFEAFSRELEQAVKDYRSQNERGVKLWLF